MPVLGEFFFYTPCNVLECSRDSGTAASVEEVGMGTGVSEPAYTAAAATFCLAQVTKIIAPWSTLETAA